MSIGLTIRKLRELRNYTQAYMADQLNLSINGYGKIERDETDITVKRLEHIASILEIDLKALIGFNPEIIFQSANKQVENDNSTHIP